MLLAAVKIAFRKNFHAAPSIENTFEGGLGRGYSHFGTSSFCFEEENWRVKYKHDIGENEIPITFSRILQLVV